MEQREGELEEKLNYNVLYLCMLNALSMVFCGIFILIRERWVKLIERTEVVV